MSPEFKVAKWGWQIHDESDFIMNDLLAMIKMIINLCDTGYRNKQTGQVSPLIAQLDFGFIRFKWYK